MAVAIAGNPRGRRAIRFRDNVALVPRTKTGSIACSPPFPAWPSAAGNSGGPRVPTDRLPFFPCSNGRHVRRRNCLLPCREACAIPSRVRGRLSSPAVIATIICSIGGRNVSSTVSRLFRRREKEGVKVGRGRMWVEAGGVATRREYSIAADDG